MLCLNGQTFSSRTGKASGLPEDRIILRDVRFRRKTEPIEEEIPEEGLNMKFYTFFNCVSSQMQFGKVANRKAGP
jgi:hypothetical protein